MLKQSGLTWLFQLEKPNKNEYKRKHKNKKDAREKTLLILQPGSIGSIASSEICSHIGNQR